MDKKVFGISFLLEKMTKVSAENSSFWGAESDTENEPENAPENEPEMRREKKMFFRQKIELYKVFKQNSRD